jgi:hypothetical protein
MFGTPAAVRPQCRRGPASFNVHPHLLQHACGFKLANEGHDTLGATALLGHKTSSHMVRYSDCAVASSKNPFENAPGPFCPTGTMEKYFG